MPKAKLDHMFAATAECEPGKKKTDWWDTTITGFVLECRSTGGRTYYLRYEDVGGRARQHKIGRYEDISFATARKEAQRLRSEVVLGVDPAAKKAKAKSIPLYSELAQMHLGLRQAEPALLPRHRGVHAKPYPPEVGKGSPDGHQ
jgi:hypothetical protein